MRSIEWYSLPQHSGHADADGDGVVEGFPGPLSPDSEEVLSFLDPMTGETMSVPIARNELCMWSESGAGPTGYGFVCADQDDSEFWRAYVTECDEDGKILEISYEVRVPSTIIISGIIVVTIICVVYVCGRS